jgi:hypothetical protein
MFRCCAKRLGLALAGLLLAAGSLAGDLPGPDDKPFAAAHILLQLSDGDEAVQTRVLNVASNLLKHYGGPDLVDLEIVAFGPGICRRSPVSRPFRPGADAGLPVAGGTIRPIPALP